MKQESFFQVVSSVFGGGLQAEVDTSDWKKRAVRIQVVFPQNIDCHLVSPTGEDLKARVVNISDTGILVRLNLNMHDLKVGETWGFHFRVGKEDYEAKAKIIRIMPQGIGFHFSMPNIEITKMLVRHYHIEHKSFQLYKIDPKTIKQKFSKANVDWWYASDRYELLFMPNDKFMQYYIAMGDVYLEGNSLGNLKVGRLGQSLKENQDLGISAEDVVEFDRMEAIEAIELAQRYIYNIPGLDLSIREAISSALYAVLYKNKAA